MTRFTASTLAVLAVALVLTSQAHALPQPFSVGTSSGVGADSYVRLGNATTNFGNATGVVVKDSNAGSTTRIGYTRFDLSTVPGVVTDANLSLEVITNNQGGGGSTPQMHTVRFYGLPDGHPGEFWIEGNGGADDSPAGELVWNNAPANNPANETFTGDAIFLGQVSVPANATPDTLNFGSPTLDTFLNQDTTGSATIMIQRFGGNGGHNLVFASKEHGGSPEPTLSGLGEGGSTATIDTNIGLGADSWIQQGNATTNHGNNTSLVTKGGNASTTRKIYLRFDLADVDLANLATAGLDMTVITNNQGGGGSTPQNHTVEVFGLMDGDAGELWDESAITWNNAPANLGGNNLDTNAIPLGSFLVLNHSSPQNVLFSSDELLTFLQADTNGAATLILRRTAGGGSNLVFASGENTSNPGPALVLSTIAQVPEPATGALALLAVAGVVARRRRPAA